MSNFQRPQVVNRGSETQLEVGEKLNKITGKGSIILLRSSYLLNTLVAIEEERNRKSVTICCKGG